jgi:hypothetical protein
VGFLFSVMWWLSCGGLFAVRSFEWIKFGRVISLDVFIVFIRKDEAICHPRYPKIINDETRNGNEVKAVSVRVHYTQGC